ncbi:MAG: hypothetical protein E7564_08285 [Ruminococcaceae bacterium]|nr:hypothetical protein [Oscillospiraceae bacterium]
MLSENLYLKKELRFKDGKFKIAMISDLHGGKKYNPKLKRDLNAMLEYLKPDLVLFSGDMFDIRANLKTEEEVRTFLTDITEYLETNNIPWANVYGNHEREGAYENRLLQPVFESYKNCISKSCSADIRGTSNHMIPIKASDSEEILFNIWGLDSGCIIGLADYEHENYTENDVICLKNPAYSGHGYDMPAFDQAMWYYQSSQELEKYCGRKIPSIMYFHIPIPEHLVMLRNREVPNLKFKGEAREGVACGDLNHGLFTAALMRGDVKGIYVGHDHLNDYTATYCGIELGFNSAMAYDEYNDDDMRGFRVFEIDESDPENYNTYLLRAEKVVPGYYD